MRFDSSGRLTAGTTGIVAAFESGRGIGATSGRTDFSSLSSTTFQFCLNETIGRPGASETAVGVGSLGLRSLSLNPVAARSSSLLISLPSFILISGSFSTFTLSSSAGLGEAEFRVYAGFRD